MKRRAVLALPAALMLGAATAQTVDELIAQYSAERIYSVVADLAKTYPGWLMLSRQWSAPSEIAPACKRLGLATLDDMKAFAAAAPWTMGQVEALTRWAAPSPFSQAGLPSASVGDLHQNVIAPQARATGNCGLTEDHVAIPTDAAKYLPTEAQLDLLMAQFPGGHPDKQYKLGDYECEEYADSFLAWLGSIGLTRLAVGKAWLSMFLGNIQFDGHVTVIAVTQQRMAWWLDPIDKARRPLSFTQWRGYTIPPDRSLIRALTL